MRSLMVACVQISIRRQANVIGLSDRLLSSHFLRNITLEL